LIFKRKAGTIAPMKKQYDPRMHSAEHILNQTMVRLFTTDRSFSAHIEKKKSKCDYRFDRKLTDEEIRGIEQKVNEIITKDMPITEEYLSKEAAKKQYSLKRLPEDADGDIRIVRVGNYDACPCIGPHVKSTKAIGGFRITSASFDNGILRIRYKLSQPE
jgi:misacylated tRNA(Ala) deacylase